MTHGLNAPARVRYADHSLAVYLAPLLEGRRVAVVGPASGDLAKRFRALGAATVVAFGGTGEGVAVRALTPGAIAAFHGKIDAVVVPDAAAVPLDAVIDEARRALGQQGLVAVVSQPADAPSALEAGGAGAGPGYYELHDALGSRFASVQMVGRGPFVGYAIAAVGESTGGVVLDTRLLPEEPAAAEAFIAIASDTPVALDAVALVQVPAGEVLEGRPGRDAGSAARVTTLEGELAQRDQKLREVENASAERWVKVQRLEHELKALDEDARKARDRAVKLSKELDDERKLRQRVELEAQMVRRVPELPRGVDPEEFARAKERADKLDAELVSAREEVARGLSRAQDLERELDETQETEAALRVQLDEAERTKVVARPRSEAPREPGVEQALRVDLALAREELAAAREEIVAAQAALAAARAARPAEPDATLQQEYARIESELASRADELIRVREQLAARDAAVRELSFSLEAAERTDAAEQLQAARERIVELSALHGALSAEALRIADENDLLRERLKQLETEALVRAAEAQEQAFRAQEPAPTPTPAAPVVDTEALRALEEKLAGVRNELVQAAGREAAAHDARRHVEARLADAQARADELFQALQKEREQERVHEQAAEHELDDERRHAAERLAEFQRLLDEERGRAGELNRQVGEARNDLARQYALNASVEDQVAQLRQELDGARAGYFRRVRELEREVEQLVQALEITGTQSQDEQDTLEALLREVDALRAERRGIALRLADAEEALRLQTARATTKGEDGAPDADGADGANGAGAQGLEGEVLLAQGFGVEGEPALANALSSDVRNDQLLADLAETAARLATTEEALVAAREALTAAEVRGDELRGSLEVTSRDLEAAMARGANAAPMQDALEASRRENAERELLVRSLVAQLEDRDLRLRAMERRLVEDVERARRTESEIWEVELRARDQKLVTLTREVERARGGHGEGATAGLNGEAGGETATLRAQLAGQKGEIDALKTALETVRAGLSSILVDGRGAVVAHDLVSILRQIEEPRAGG